MVRKKIRTSSTVLIEPARIIGGKEKPPRNKTGGFSLIGGRSGLAHRLGDTSG